jgi:hypothetical protein
VLSACSAAIGQGDGADSGGSDTDTDTDADAAPDTEPTPGQDDSPGSAPLAWREQAVGSSDNVSLTFVATATALGAGDGDLYVAIVSLKPPRAIDEVTGLGLIWHPVRQQCTGRSTAALAMFWAQGSATAGDVTALLAGAASIGSGVLSVHRYTGADPAQPIGASTWANTNGVDGGAACQDGIDTTAYGWSSMDTAAARSLVLVGAHTANYATHEPGDGFTERADHQSGTTSTSAGVAVEEATLDAPAVDLAISGSFGDREPDWAAIAIEIRD